MDLFLGSRFRVHRADLPVGEVWCSAEAEGHHAALESLCRHKLGLVSDHAGALGGFGLYPGLPVALGCVDVSVDRQESVADAVLVTVFAEHVDDRYLHIKWRPLVWLAWPVEDFLHVGMLDAAGECGGERLRFADRCG